MNVSLLRLAHRNANGDRRWSVPNQFHAVTYVRDNPMWRASSLIWPGVDAKGDVVRRSVRLDWHWKIARNEIRALVLAS